MNNFLKDILNKLNDALDADKTDAEQSFDLLYVMQDRFKNVIIPMEATGIFDSTKFKDLSEKEQKKFLLTNDKDSWRGYEIYEGDITAIRYDKERTEYDVVSYYKGGFSKGCTALSSYQKFTKIVGNLFEGYPEEANYSVNFYKENYEEAL